MNILLTAAGRRSYLVRYFQEALAGSGKVVCANSIMDSPAMLAADTAVQVPESHQPEYISRIFQICKEHGINAILSLHDLDALILSKHRQAFLDLGVVPIIPDERWAEIALDKSRTADFVKSLGLGSPWTSVKLEEALEALDTGELHFPVILKSRFGFGSLGLETCNSRDELIQLHQKVASLHGNLLRAGYGLNLAPDSESVLIQEKIRGNEYCVSLVNDLEGQPRASFALKVTSMRSGESDTAHTIDAAPFLNETSKVAQATGHFGIWGMDVIEKDGNHYIIDINPRFTGDYPFQQLAGADVPRAIVSWLQGRVPEPSWLKPKIGVRGFKELVPRALP